MGRREMGKMGCMEVVLQARRMVHGVRVMV